MPLVPSYIESLEPYEAGRTAASVRRQYGLDRVIKLASNENPLGASPLAVAALRRSLDALHVYPDGGLALREALSRRFTVKVENVIAASGSEGVLSAIARAFLAAGDEVLTTEAAFIGFQVLARASGVRYRTVPYRDWHYDLTALAAAAGSRTKLIYLANPNNPTGTIFTRREFEEFHRKVPAEVLIVLDEAYFEYASHDPDYPDSMRYRYDNVITLRTFSKAYGLAGARIGYGFAHEDLIRSLLKVKLPFEPSAPAQAAALGALEDSGFLRRTLELNARALRGLTEGLAGLGLPAAPSHANFVMTALPEEREARRIFESLLAQGVVVRHLRAFGLPHCLRISTGSDDDNRRCIEALRRSCASGAGENQRG